MNTEKQLQIPNMKSLVAAFEVGKKSQDPKLVRKNSWKCPISKLYVIFSCSFFSVVGFLLAMNQKTKLNPELLAHKQASYVQVIQLHVLSVVCSCRGLAVWSVP